MVASLFPLGIGPEPALLRRIGPGVLWVARCSRRCCGAALFAADHADGTLEQMVSPQSFALQMAGGAGALAAVGLPLLMRRRCSACCSASTARRSPLLASLLIGTPLLSLIGSVGAALTLGLRGGGVLLLLLVLPLYVPALVFGAGAVEAQSPRAVVRGHLSLLGALLMLALRRRAAGPTTAALRIATRMNEPAHALRFRLRRPVTFYPLAGRCSPGSPGSPRVVRRSRDCGSASSSRPPTPSRATATASSSSMCRRLDVDGASTW